MQFVNFCVMARSAPGWLWVNETAFTLLERISCTVGEAIGANLPRTRLLSRPNVETLSGHLLNTAPIGFCLLSRPNSDAARTRPRV